MKLLSGVAVPDGPALHISTCRFKSHTIIMAELKNAIHRALNHQMALPDHPSLDLLVPKIRNPITTLRVEATPEKTKNYRLEVEFYCLIQAGARALVEYRLRSWDMNVSQDEMDSYYELCWNTIAGTSHAVFQAAFEGWIAFMASDEEGDGTGEIANLFGNLSIS